MYGGLLVPTMETRMDIVYLIDPSVERIEHAFNVLSQWKSPQTNATGVQSELRVRGNGVSMDTQACGSASKFCCKGKPWG
jgi:hypothetical protein